MPLDLDFTKFKTPHKTYDNCTVVDVLSGAFPRYIQVRMPGDDGAIRTARWNGALNLANSDTVLCYEYPGNPVLHVADYGGSKAAGVDGVKVSKVYWPDISAVALQSDATGQIGIGTAVPAVLLHATNADTASFEVESTGGAGNANVIVTRDTTADYASLVFQTENTVDWQFQVRADVDDAKALVWRNGSNQNKMALLQTGELGVGTTSPQAELHVSGTGAIDLEVESTNSNANLIITRAANTNYASFVFRYGDTQDWQFQVRADVDDGSALVWRNGSNQNKVFFYQTGEFGVGAQPQGIFHVYDTISGFLLWEYDGLDATVRTIVANGAGDCLYRLHAEYVLRDSAAAVASGTTDVSNSASVNLTVGGNTVRLRVNADGSIDAARTAGTDTIKVAFTLRWL